MIAARAAAACLLLAACSDDDGADHDAGDAHDAPPDTPSPCTTAPAAPTAAPPWLDAELARVIDTLAGVPDRATAARRTAARTFLAAELDALGLDATLDDYGTGANVVATLPATVAGGDPVLVGAHFDTVSDSPGANDNATGVATVLAAARALRDLPCRDRPVVFALFDQEEIGLVGSTQLAGRSFAAGVAFAAVHTIDQVGWDGDRDRRFEIELPTDGLWAEYQAGAAAIGVSVVRTSVGGTDHSAFRERGYPAAGVTEEFAAGDTTPHYHQPTDVPSTIDRAYAALATRLVTYVVARELGAR